MYWPLENACLVQISGPQPARLNPLSASTRAPAVPGGDRAPRGETAEFQRPAEKSPQLPSVLPGCPPNKRPRLSSWRRRKAKQQRTVASEEELVTEGTPHLTAAPVVMPPVAMRSAAMAPVATAAMRAVTTPAGLAMRGQAKPGSATQARMKVAGDRRASIIVPRKHELPGLMKVLIKRHRRTSYHKLLCAHMPHQPLPPSPPISAARWADVHRFSWAIGASVVPPRLLGHRANLHALMVAAARTTIAPGLKERRLVVPSQLTERLRTTAAVGTAAKRADGAALHARAPGSAAGPTTSGEHSTARGPAVGTHSRGRGAKHAQCARRRLRALGEWVVMRLLVPSLRRTLVAKSSLRHAEPGQCTPWPRGVWKRAFRQASRAVVRASLHELPAAEAVRCPSPRARAAHV